ncbi:Integrase [uncultured Flavonifractor sp.]|nr:Integrase [uncultured Flavonifractor sp.]
MGKYGKTIIKGIEYYRTRLSLPNGKRKSLYAKTVKELDILVNAEQENIKANSANGECPTVEEYAKLRLEFLQARVQPQTYVGYKEKVQLYIASAPLGKKLLTEVTTDDIEQALLPVSAMSSSYYRTVHMLLRSIFKAAKKSHLIAEDPTEGLSSRGGKPAKDLPALTDDQAELLLATVHGLRVETFVMLGLYAGLRREEILALQWDCVHLDVQHPYLDICRTWHIIANQPVVTDVTKTEAGRRSIPIPPVLADQLRLDKSKSTSDYVVANSSGGALSGSQWRNLWNLVSKRTTQERSYSRYKKGHVKSVHTVSPRLGNVAKHNPNVIYSIDFHPTPHQLRRTYITNLIHSGADPKTVQYLAGHKNAKITMDIYAKVKYNRPEDLASTVNNAFPTQDGKDAEKG